MSNFNWKDCTYVLGEAKTGEQVFHQRHLHGFVMNCVLDLCAKTDALIKSESTELAVTEQIRRNLETIHNSANYVELYVARDDQIVPEPRGRATSPCLASDTLRAPS